VEAVPSSPAKNRVGRKEGGGKTSGQPLSESLGNKEGRDRPREASKCVEGEIRVCSTSPSSQGRDGEEQEFGRGSKALENNPNHIMDEISKEGDLTNEGLEVMWPGTLLKEGK